MERKIHFLIESIEGHTDIMVPENEATKEVNKQLEDGKWVTLEKTNGETQIITEPIKPVTEATPTEGKPDEWKNAFGANKEPDWKDVKTAVSTGKIRGG
jgi:hypothetical protein